MPKLTSGLVNASNPKRPNPPPSPKGFVWPDRKQMRNGLFPVFAAALKEVMTEKNVRANRLGVLMYGATPKGIARSFRPNSWLKQKGIPPDEVEAGYIAQVLDVPMARLLESKSGGTTRTPEVGSGDAAIKKAKRTFKRAQVPEEDSRWLLPTNVPKPRIKIETSAEHDAMTHVELNAELPAHVAMAIYSMVNEYRVEPKSPQEAQT